MNPDTTTAPPYTPSLTDSPAGIVVSDDRLGTIEFTEDDIAANRNKFAPVDGRMLPRLNQKSKPRTGKCERCGARCWPYTTCAKHREFGTIHRILKKMEASGELIRVTDGRGRKGGAIWKVSEEMKAKAAAEKAARTMRRTAPKIGRNDPCSCGSGRKYKACCLHGPNTHSPIPNHQETTIPK